MKISGKMFIVAAVGVWLVCFATMAAAGSGPSDTLVPSGLVIQDTFVPGLGAPVGSVHMVEGEALLIHADSKIGYRAAKDLPLFKGDLLITGEGGKLQFALNDGSQILLSSETHLVITQSMYDRAENTRSSFMDMSVGRVRFLVTKFIGPGSFDFKVKTETAIIGVRGSDFIVGATPQLTETTALKDTSIAVASLAYPDEKPVLLFDYERTIIKIGERPSAAMKVMPEEIERMLEEFRIAPPSAPAETRAAAVEETAKKPAAPPVGGILLPPASLVPPELPAEGTGAVSPSFTDVVKDELIKRDVTSIDNQQDTILEDKMTDMVEENIKQELPPVPGVPD
ncbi:MAG: FecR domain-containing protein [Deltaproteobacteria bacterium]|nr:FecR domain-containing protein [Deltaproteobacteria bacterium]